MNIVLQALIYTDVIIVVSVVIAIVLLKRR